MKTVIGLAAAVLLLGVVNAGVKKYLDEPYHLKKAFIPIVRLHGSNDNSGNYNFDSESADGTRFMETGSTKLVKGEIGAIKSGEVSWTSPEGQLFTLSYTADEFGFHPKGSHLPTPPPIPAEIARSLALLPKLKKNKEYVHDYSAPAPPPPKPHHDNLKPKPHYNKPMMNMMSIGAPAPVNKPQEMSFKPKPQEMSFKPQNDAIVPILMGSQPLRTDVETSEFSIHSDPSKTIVRIGKF